MRITIADHAFVQCRTMFRTHGWFVSGSYHCGHGAVETIRGKLHQAINTRARVKPEYKWGNTLVLIRSMIGRGAVWTSLGGLSHRTNVKRIQRRLKRAQERG